jgi:hypothetical protein
MSETLKHHEDSAEIFSASSQLVNQRGSLAETETFADLIERSMAAFSYSSFFPRNLKKIFEASHPDTELSDGKPVTADRCVNTTGVKAENIVLIPDTLDTRIVL